jgi:hypothetical protein
MNLMLLNLNNISNQAQEKPSPTKGFGNTLIFGSQETAQQITQKNRLFFIDLKDAVLYLSSKSPDKEQINHFKYGALQPWHPHPLKKSSTPP